MSYKSKRKPFVQQANGTWFFIIGAMHVQIAATAPQQMLTFYQDNLSLPANGNVIQGG
jgi:hypothetical protein